MPPSAEDCRAKAIQCAELASKTRDRFSKRLLEQTAEQWNVLAVGAERYEEIQSRRTCCGGFAFLRSAVRTHDRRPEAETR
jgi:hypothetical protein